MTFNSIRARMAIMFLFSITLVMVLSGSGLILYSRTLAEAEGSNLLISTADRLIAESKNSERPGNLDDLLSEEKGTIDHRISLYFMSESHGLLGKLVQKERDIPSPGDTNWRTRTVPLGPYVALIALDWSEARHRLDEQAKGILAIALLVIVVSGIGAWVLVGKTLGPIGKLTAQASSASVERLRLQLTAPSQDAEIVQLVDTLNGMLGRLSQTAETKGRFYAAASHELRTPLQALTGHLELSLSRQRTNEEREATIREAHTQTQRLTSLVSELLTLNRLENSESTPDIENVSLKSVCELTIWQLEKLQIERTLRVVTEFEGAAEISAPRTFVEILVRNLVENALKYSAQSGEVRIFADTKKLIVSNTFPDDKRLDTNHLFEAFSRQDASRNSETGGNGLGLTICKAITDANGWKIGMTQSKDIVTCTVEFER